MNIIDKRASNPAAALDGTELVYVAQLGADAVTTVQDIQYFATNGFLLITTAASTYVAKNAPITGATKTKITYNTDGLITSGADATTADIADSPNRRYITDAQQTVLNNTSNTNSGDETTATIKTKLGAASSTADGYLTSTDWNTFDSKLKTINHTSAGTITLVPGYKVTQIISTAATMTLTGGVATDQSEIVRIIARVDTTISLTGAIIAFGDGHTLNNIGTTYTVYKGETIDLYMPAANAFYVHGQHIQDSGSLAIYKPTTNNKISFNLSALTASKTITFPNADVDLGAPVTAAQINWGFVGFGTTPAGLTITNASGATSQVDMSSVIVSSEYLVNGLVHGARTSARYIVTTGSTFNVDLNTLTLPYYVQFEANHGGGTATLVITIAGITTFFDAKSSTTLGGSPLTIKITPGEVITIRTTQSSTLAIVDRSLDVGIASDNRTNTGYRAVFRAPVDFTNNRTITVPNANVNLGDLPSVAVSYITGAMAGTRSQCVGGSLNVFSGGTDNVAVGSTSCELHGTSNSVINSQTTTFTASSSNCVVLGGNSVILDESTRVAAINSRFCNVYGTDNAVINTSYGNIGASATKCSIVGGYGVSGTTQFIGNTGVTNVNFFGTVSCSTNSNCEDVTLLNCRKFIATSTQKRLTALNVTKFSDSSNIPFPDTTLLVGTNGYLKSLVKLYAVTAADTVAVEALADNATFPTTNKRVKSFITTDTDLQGIGRVLHKVSVAIRDNATGNDVTFATRYVATYGNSVILAPTANGTTDIIVGSGIAFTLTAAASSGSLQLSVASTGSIASTAVLVVESEYF